MDVGLREMRERIVETFGGAWSTWHRMVPSEGPVMWTIGRPQDKTVIGVSWLSDGKFDWTHASISHEASLPTYVELKQLKEVVFGSHGEAYQVFPPAAEHVNLHHKTLHLWGRTDGESAMPELEVK